MLQPLQMILIIVAHMNAVLDNLYFYYVLSCSKFSILGGREAPAVHEDWGVLWLGAGRKRYGVSHGDEYRMEPSLSEQGEEYGA